MRYHSYLNSAAAIIRSYKGDQPFAVFIKKYFSAHKKYGGRDRKQISALCYNYYRLGKALPAIEVEEKLIAACFLCERTGTDFLDFHKPDWNLAVTKPLPEKMQMAKLDMNAVFPWADELSSGIEFEPFATSFFEQPDLFLRIRPGNKDLVKRKIADAGLMVAEADGDSLALPNATKIESLLEIDKEVVIQDYNSQQVLNFLKKNDHGIDLPARVWDSCAASGGKSILANDLLSGKMELLASDIRESILSNLTKRFARAGIKKFKTFRVDLVTPGPDTLTKNNGPAAQNPQIIICDAPCTGSGTWSRTPEQLHFFNAKKIEVYAGLQRNIVSACIPVLKKNGLFFYITCSVFKKENELMVQFIKEKFHLQLVQMELLKGYAKKADSMFVAAFRKV